MAILKKKEIRSISLDERKSKLEELRKDLIKLSVQRSTGTSSKNPHQIKEVKRTIARILTSFKDKKKVKSPDKNKKEGQKKPNNG